MARLENKEALKELRDTIQARRQQSQKRMISLCAGSGCAAYGTSKVAQALSEELSRQDMQNEVEIKLSGCHGFCEKGPIMVLHPEGIFYPQVKVEHIPDIVEKTIRNGEVIDALVFKDISSKTKIINERDIPFYKLQQLRLLG